MKPSALSLLSGLLLLLTMLSIGPLQAESEAGVERPSVATQPATADAGDRQIERRLARIYSRVEGLSGVRVSVNAGVVNLTGEAPGLETIARAEALAAEAEGVVAVQNDIAISRDVIGRLQGVGAKFKQIALDTVSFLPLLLVALAIIVLFVFLANRVERAAALFDRILPNAFISSLARQILRMVTIVIGIVLALVLLDATTLIGTVLGAAGVVGIALGFALRDTVENYIASILLSLRQPFAPFDHIVVDGQEGKVIRLTSRATILMTLDGNHLRLPNAQVYKSVLLNYSTNPKRRFDFVVGVDPEQPLDEVLELAVQELDAMPGVVDEPGPGAVISALGDSTVDIRITGWVDQREFGFGKVRSEAIRRVKATYDKAGIGMPEPGYRLNVSGPARSELTVTDKGQEKPPAPAQPPVVEDEAPATAEELRPDDDIERQIQAERKLTGEEDLLDKSAPRE